MSAQQPPPPVTEATAQATQPSRKRRERKPSLFGQAKERGLLWLAGAIHGTQIRFARYMNRKTQGWSRRQQRLFLVFFVIIAQAASFTLLFWENKTMPPALDKPSLYQGVPMPPQTLVKPRLTRTDSLHMVAFRRRLDSLMATPAGRDSVAAFNRRRPGFIDSVLAMGQHLQPAR